MSKVKKKGGANPESAGENADLCVISPVDAVEAGEALMAVANRLGRVGVLTQEGARRLENQGRSLKARKRQRAWPLLIDPDEKVTFEETKDKAGKSVYPWLCANLAVDQSLKGRPPFTALDIAVQFDDLDGIPIARWHIDLANQQQEGYQSGPLFHLQFGGHLRGFRDLDHPLKAPRWCHPPMEAALICEVIAANFYEDKWLSLREDPSWCEAISQFQRLCYPEYLNKLSQSLKKLSSTMLNESWAGDWIKHAELAYG